jgi:hypothetical protein
MKPVKEEKSPPTIQPSDSELNVTPRSVEPVGLVCNAQLSPSVVRRIIPSSPTAHPWRGSVNFVP